MTPDLHVRNVGLSAAKFEGPRFGSDVAGKMSCESSGMPSVLGLRIALALAASTSDSASIQLDSCSLVRFLAQLRRRATSGCCRSTELDCHPAGH